MCLAFQGLVFWRASGVPLRVWGVGEKAMALGDSQVAVLLGMLVALLFLVLPSSGCPSLSGLWALSAFHCSDFGVLQSAGSATKLVLRHLSGRFSIWSV